MDSFNVKCHPPGSTIPSNCFFVLSRGRNSGRPAFTPNTNCFIITTEAQHLNTYFWLVYALWSTGKFEPYLHGSVIDLIRIGDFKKVVLQNLPNLKVINKALIVLIQLRDLETNLKKQLNLIKQSRRALLCKM